MEQPFVLTIDIGTSSIRVTLFDQQGRQIQDISSQEPLYLNYEQDGTAEGDPNKILASVFRCIDNTIRLADPLAKDIVGVGITTLAGNLLGIDKSNQAVTPLLTYADTRAATEALQLRNELDEYATHQRTGCNFHSSYFPAQFKWMVNNQSAWLKQAVKWVSIADYIYLTLFGEACTSYSIAAWTGLLNRQTLSWDKELFTHLPVDPEQMLPLCDYTYSFSSLKHEYATRWPELSVPWLVAIGDGAAANFGSGCISPNQIALTIGTTGAMRIITNKPIEHIPWGLWNYPINRHRSLTGGAMTEGGNVYAWMMNNLSFKNYSSIEHEIAKKSPDSHGLTILPFFAGERSPGWIDNARATIHGLSFNTSSIDIIRAGLEAIAIRFSFIYELLAPLTNHVEMVASGGALLRNPLWLQILSDVLNCPVTFCNVTEVSSRGTALLALEVLTDLSDLSKVPHFYGPKYLPNRKNHEIYQRARVRQRDLYQALVSPNSLQK